MVFLVVFFFWFCFVLSKEKPQHFLNQNKSKYCSVTLGRAKGWREDLQKVEFREDSEETKTTSPEMSIQLLFRGWIWGEEELFNKAKHQTAQIRNSFLHNTPRCSGLTYAGNVVMSQRGRAF